ncbi:MAG: RNA-directed DNA polymerase, partial [Oscillospiraceae bacterium]|nr:RNA-directed DNA polymerase [Oscillospiraceae bacterium]
CLSQKTDCYRVYSKQKKDGTRTIHAIKSDSGLYVLQHRMQQKFLNNIYLPDTVYGFREHCSYIDFLIPHISEEKDRCFLRLDIKDFFGSIRIDDLKEALKYYVSDEIENADQEKILDKMIEIVTVDQKVVQGAVTSPMLSNLVFRQLDIRIERYCSRFNLKYTRYADDMLFSGRTSYIHSRKFMAAIAAIIESKGFSLNYSKTLRAEQEISLNGFVIGSELRVSRKKLHKLNEIMHRLNSREFDKFSSDYELYHVRNQLAGYRSFLLQVLHTDESEARKYKIQIKIDRIEALMRKYCKID